MIGHLPTAKIAIDDILKSFASLRGPTGIKHHNDESNLSQRLRLDGLWFQKGVRDPGSLRTTVNLIDHRITVLGIKILGLEDHSVELSPFVLRQNGKLLRRLPTDSVQNRGIDRF